MYIIISNIPMLQNILWGMRRMENKRKHLEMIQNVISRISANSFSIKGWAVTLVAGIFALANKDADKSYFLVAYVPIIIFWGLDSYYLLQERLFRALYNKVRILKEEEIDFSMDSSFVEFNTDRNTFLRCFFSSTVFGFYCPLALITAGIIFLTQVY